MRERHRHPVGCSLRGAPLELVELGIAVLQGEFDASGAHGAGLGVPNLGPTVVSPTPGTEIFPTRASRSDSNSIGEETVPSLLGATDEKISNAAPPCWPVHRASMAARCSARRFIVDDDKDLSVALVHGSWKREHTGEDDAIERGAAEMALVDPPRHQGVAIALRRYRVELARAAPVAIAACELLSADTPVRLRY